MRMIIITLVFGKKRKINFERRFLSENKIIIRPKKEKEISDYENKYN